LDDDTLASDGGILQAGKPDSLAVPESTETVNKEAFVDSHHEMAPYIGDTVAENITVALGQLSNASEELVTQTWDVYQRIRGPQPNRGFETDEVTLALAIIRFASEEIEDPIPHSTLDDVLEDGNYDVYHVTKIVAEKIKQR
jgi:hypothetical protein